MVLREIVSAEAVWLLAMLAEDAHQSLAHNGPHAGCEKKALHPHIDHSRDCASGGVCVQRRENKMPCERSMNANVSGFGIAHFAHHDHIGILPQE